MTSTFIDTSEAAPKTMYGLLAAEYCKKNLPLEVLQSNAGFYIGTLDEDLPCSRESVEYYSTEAIAQHAFDKGTWTQRTYP